MPAKGGSTALAPTRLPPLPKLRVRRPNKFEQNPCMSIMSSVLACWASAGNRGPGTCAPLEKQLRQCMDAPKPPAAKKSTLNYHLSRLYPKIIGPRKWK